MIERIAPLLVLSLLLVTGTGANGEINARTVTAEDAFDDVKGSINEYVNSSGPASADIIEFSVRNLSGNVNASFIIRGEISFDVAYELFIGPAYFSYHEGVMIWKSLYFIEDLEYPMPCSYTISTSEIRLSFPSIYIPEVPEMGILFSSATYDGRITDVCPDEGDVGVNDTYDLFHPFEYVFIDGELDLIEHVQREELNVDRPYLDILELSAVDDGVRVTFYLKLASAPSVKKDIRYEIYCNQVLVRILEGMTSISYDDGSMGRSEPMHAIGSTIVVEVDRSRALPLTRDGMRAFAREFMDDGVSFYEDGSDPQIDLSVWNIDYDRFRAELVLDPLEDFVLCVHIDCPVGERGRILEAIPDEGTYNEVMLDPIYAMDAMIVPVVTLDGIELEPELALLEETLFSPVGDTITLTWTYTIPHEELSGGSHTVGYYMRDLPYMMYYYDPGDLEITVEGGWEISRVDRISVGHGAEQQDKTHLRADARIPHIEFTIREAGKGGEGTCFGIAGAISVFAAIVVFFRFRS